MRKCFVWLVISILFALAVPSLSSGEGPGSIVPGEDVSFGCFPQAADGKEALPIIWTVLDMKDGKCLLLSKYGLDARPYNAEDDDTVTWKTCSLRSWLNGEFFETAFSMEEKAAILLTDVDNSSVQNYSGWKTSGSDNTQDHIFLLSYGEANRYLGLEYHGTFGRKARVAPTAYAVRAGAWTTGEILTSEGRITGWWLLRSPGKTDGSAACVNNGGSLSDCSYSLASGCIRPVLWLDAGILSEE